MTNRKTSAEPIVDFPMLAVLTYGEFWKSTTCPVCSETKWKYSALCREDLAALAGYSVTSSAFKNPLSALKTKGLLSYPQSGDVKIADWFLEL
jgi:hypothetical protein